MPEPFYYNFADDFLGGVNSYAPANKIQDRFLVQAQNAFVNENGVITRRPGITKLGTISHTNVDDAYFLVAAGKGDQHKVHVLLGVTSSEDLNTKGWDGTSWLTPIVQSKGIEEASATWYSHDTGVSETAAGDGSGPMVERLMVSGSYSAVAANPARYTFTASTVSPVGTLHAGAPQGCRYFVTHEGRVWAAGQDADLSASPGDTGGMNVLYYSEPYPNMGVWDRTIGGNRHMIAPSTGDMITGLSPYRETGLFIGCGGQCFLMHMNAQIPNSPINPISRDIGCGSHKSIAFAGDDLLFMDQYGNVRSVAALQSEFQTGVRQLAVSAPIKDQTELVDTQKLHRSCAAFYNGNYWFYVLKSDGTGALHTFNTALRIWTGPHVLKNAAGTTLIVKAMGVGFGTPGGGQFDDRGSHLYFLTDTGTAGDTRFQVYELDSSVYQDEAAQAIDWDVHSKAQDFEKPHQEKDYRTLEVTYKKVAGTEGLVEIFARAFDCQLDWVPLGKIDYTQATFDIETATFDLSNIPRSRLLQLRLRCRTKATHPEIIRLVVSGHLVEAA